jgi:hypothetical protein
MSSFFADASPVASRSKQFWIWIVVSPDIFSFNEDCESELTRL